MLKENRFSTNKKQGLTIIILIVIAGLLGFAGYFMLESRNKKNLDALEKEKVAWQEKNVKLQDKINSLENTISKLSGDTGMIPEEGGNPVAESGSGQPAEGPEKPVSIEDVERRIAAFFVHLDKQEYIKEYNFQKNAYDEYEDIIEKLSKKEPLLTNETASLYNVFLNMAHFYRVLGKEKISLIKDILANEDIEPVMKDFYQWYTYDGKDRKKIKGRPSQQVLYEYACFFLNTIGGRNYLMRRDAKIRILTTYYSVLILDRANDLKQNPNGIDIRPYLRMVISDFSGKSGFVFYPEYMKNLRRLADKYNIN